MSKELDVLLTRDTVYLIHPAQPANWRRETRLYFFTSRFTGGSEKKKKGNVYNARKKNPHTFNQKAAIKLNQISKK